MKGNALAAAQGYLDNTPKWGDIQICLITCFAIKRMKHLPIVFAAGLLAGCAAHRDDPRLQGTWHSNRDATVAAAFQRDPRWTNATPEHVARFRDVFGNMTIAYSNRVETSNYRGEVQSFRYRVVGQGPDYVIIRSEAPMEEGRDIRIRFVDNNFGYWIDTGPLGFGNQERFDMVSESANPQGGANGRQPFGSETNAAPAAAASRRSP